MKKPRVGAVMVVLAVATVGGLAAWGYFEAVSRAWIPYNEYDIRTEGQLRVGDIAPDFTLANVNGADAKLSDFYRDKPLVLIFGSYT